MRKFLFLTTTLVMILMFQNCAQNIDFKSDSGLTLSASTGDPDGILPNVPPTDLDSEKVEQFKVAFNSEAAPLDMIWVIDNSGSMSQEAALVRKNFDAFLTDLNKSTNFRLLLVSATTAASSAYGVSIPSSFDENTHKQINRNVGSTNGPELLLAELKSLPAGFLRANSKKIIVFVTDDNSRLNSRDFMASLIGNQNWAQEDISVSSFIGLGKAQSSCQANEGLVYRDLASQSGGQVYNICLPDWTSNFSDLLDVSVSKAVRRFAVASSVVKEIIEVKVDGLVLPTSMYSSGGNAITLSDNVILAENSQVTIRYK